MGKRMSKRTSRCLQTTLESWESGLARLGEAIVGFNRIEDALARCIASMIGRDRHLGDILTAELSFRASVVVFEALFLHRSKLPALPAELRDVIARIHEAEQIRNGLVHADWDANPRQPTTIRKTKMSIRARKGLQKAIEDVAPDDLDELTRTFAGIADDLWYMMQEYLPRFAARLR